MNHRAPNTALLPTLLERYPLFAEPAPHPAGAAESSAPARLPRSPADTSFTAWLGRELAASGWLQSIRATVQWRHWERLLLEAFSAGLVHHAAEIKRLDELLATPPATRAAEGQP